MADQIALSAGDKNVLDAAAQQLASFDPFGESEKFVLEAQLHSGSLSRGLRRSMIEFRRFGDRQGGILIKHVPIGSVPPTPEQPGRASANPERAIAAMSVLLACIGEQYGFRPELGGAIVQDIVPTVGFEKQQISLSSSVDLEIHVEMAFSQFRSDYVALLCIRQDHDRQAGTTLSSVDTFLPLLDSKTIDTLREPRFRTKVDASFLLTEKTTKTIWVDPIRVLDGPEKRPWVRADFAETEGKDEEAEAALSVLRRVALETRRVIHLQPGDLLIVDNNRALHGRVPFKPRYDGSDRWLLRSFITKDLRRSEAMRPSDGRIVDPDYPVDEPPHQVLTGCQVARPSIPE